MSPYISNRKPMRLCRHIDHLVPEKTELLREQSFLELSSMDGLYDHRDYPKYDLLNVVRNHFQDRRVGVTMRLGKKISSYLNSGERLM